ncbi:MAG: hypothetical protein GY909_06140 [Oligoflexia bacterium]|nr:hypothetical protein [Oligoflexia bacterium]
MKTIRPLLTLTTLLLLLTSCMPDSFTKFKEDPPAKKTSANGGSAGSGSGSGSGGGGAAATPTPTTAPTHIQVVGGDSTFIYYPYEVAVDADGNEVAPQTIVFEAIGGTAVDGEVIYSITPTLPADMSFDTSTGIISGQPQQFYPMTTFQITATHSPTSTTIYSSTPLTPVSIQIGAFSKIENFNFPQSVGQSLIIELQERTAEAVVDPDGNITSPAIYGPLPEEALLEDFPLGTTISNASGVTATVRWYDTDTSSIYVEITANPSSSYIDILEPDATTKGSIDNSGTFATERAYVGKVTYAFQTEAAASNALPGVPAAFSPSLTPSTLNASTELADWITWSISPELPNPAIGALTIDSGTIGSVTAGGGFGGNGTISGFLSNTGESLLPTTYTITAKSGPSSSTSTYSKQIGISVLDYPLPKKLTSTNYRIPASTKMVLDVASITPFTVGETVSNRHGFQATIDSIDTANARLFVTTAASGATYGYIGTDTTAKREIDDQATFLTAATTVNDVYFVYPSDGATALSLIPDPNVLSSVENELSGLVTFTAASAAVTGFQTKFDEELIGGANAVIILAGTAYTIASVNSATSLTLAAPAASSGTNQPYKASVIDQVDERGTHTYSISPDPAIAFGGGFSFLNTDATNPGTMTINPVSTIFPQQEFTVTATDLFGRTAETSVKMGAFRAPVGLATTRAMLLNVPSRSAFTAGDFISSSSGGKGIVLETFNVSAMNDYVKIKVLSGTFEEFDDIDNRDQFQTQRTYIYDNGAIPYNTELALANVTNFSSTSGSNDIWVGGGSYSASTTRGTIQFINGLNVYVMAEQGSFLNSGAQTAQSDAGGSATINDLKANNVILNGVSSVPATAVIGQDIGSNNGAVGTIQNISGTNVTVTHLSAGTTFDIGGGNEIEYVSPLTGGATVTTTSVEYDDNYYLYRDEEAVIYAQLDSTRALAAGETLDVTYSVKGAGNESLPSGLTLDTATGIISGTPDDASALIQYTLTATTPSGSVSTTFGIQVIDHFEVKLDDTNRPYSYIFHRGAQGMGRAPCRVTKEQMANAANGTPVDITCYLEAGQLDLWQNGTDFVFTSGNDMCQYITERPFGFNELKPTASTTGFTLIENTGSLTNSLCTDRYNGGTNIERFPINASLATAEQISSASEMCIGDYTANKIREALGISGATGRNCDEGTFIIQENAYDTSSSSCLADACTGCGTAPCSQWLDYNSCVGDGGTWAPEGGGTDATACQDANGDCSGCDTAPCTAFTTRATCEADNGTWTPTAGVFGQYCLLQTNVEQTIEECGGEGNACVRGPQDDRFATNIQGRAQFIHAKSNGTDISVGYNAPEAQANYLGFTPLSTNKYLASYSNTSLCDNAGTYTYDFTNLDAYANSTTMDDPLRGGFPFYEVRCVDGSFNTKARIRFHIRDWNAPFTASSNIDRSDPGTTLMDITGNDPVFGLPYDQYTDWDSTTDTSFATCGTRSADGALTGTVSVNTGSQRVTGVGTAFLTEVAVGAVITISGNQYLVGAVNSNTSLTIMSKSLTTSAGVAATVVRGYKYPVSGF